MHVIGLHTLWPVGRDSFRILVGGQLRRLPSPHLAAADSVRPMLGDALIDRPCQQLTRCMPIDAPAPVVWRWLAQMMRGAGTYGWPRLESTSCRSAEHLLKGLTPPTVGDRLGNVLALVAVRPGKEVVWQAARDFVVLDFALDQVTLNYQIRRRGAETCRLLVRLRASCRLLTNPICAYLLDVIDFTLPAHQLLRIKSLSERNGACRATADSACPVAQYQALPLEAAGTLRDR